MENLQDYEVPPKDIYVLNNLGNGNSNRNESESEEQIVARESDRVREENISREKTVQEENVSKEEPVQEENGKFIFELKSKQEDDSGVLDLFNDLAADNEDILLNITATPSVKKDEPEDNDNNVIYGPGPTTDDFSILDMFPKEKKRLNNRNLRAMRSKYFFII